MQQREPKVFAHRGASGVFFGNSFGAFDEALRQHTDGLETDAWQTRDGVIVLHHSNRENRKFLPIGELQEYFLEILLELLMKRCGNIQMGWKRTHGKPEMV